MEAIKWSINMDVRLLWSKHKSKLNMQYRTYLCSSSYLNAMKLEHFHDPTQNIGPKKHIIVKGESENFAEMFMWCSSFSSL